MTRKIYFIREKDSNTWCSSSKHSEFVDDFDYASVFLKKENAEKAIKEITRGLSPKYSNFPYWYLRGQVVRGMDVGREDIPLVIPRFEAVGFELNEVLE